MSSSSYNRTHHPSRKLSHMTGLRGSNLVDVEVFANCVSWLIYLTLPIHVGMIVLGNDC